jgi:hypothetical protein
MLPLKWTTFILLCIFAPKGCVLQNFFSSEQKVSMAEVKAPYGTLFPTSTPKEYVLIIPGVSAPTMQEGKGWVIYGKDNTHLKIDILKSSQAGDRLKVFIQIHDEIPSRPLSPLIIQYPES